MGVLDAASFAGKLVVKTGLVATGVAITVLEEATKFAISKGATPPQNYDSDKVNGLANSIFELNKKIKL